MFEEGYFINNTYQIIQEIGSGGTGIIYLAYHVNLQKYVVLKKIKDLLMGRINARVEVDLLKQLHHPGLPQVYDFLEVEGAVYTVIDYINGYDLNYYIKQGYTFTEEQIEDYLIQLLDVLEYLHGQKPEIIHSDIKPGNIMLDADGKAYLIDFNISFDSEAGKVTGISPAYASYEQMAMIEHLSRNQDIQNIRIDGRSDLYSLGAAFYHLITGIVPYLGIEEQNPVYNQAVPYKEALLMIIDKAMKPLPEQRYQSAKEMKRAVERIRTASIEYKLKRVCIVGGCLAGALLISAGILGIYSGMENKKQTAFTQKYQEIVLEANNGKSVQQQALDFLNDKEYEKYLEQDEEKQASLLYLIATEYLDQQQYSQAISYYEAAIIHNPGTALYRDYAIALIRGGQQEKAQEILNQAPALGITSYELEEIQAELDVNDQNYSQAAERLNNLIAACNDDELKYRSLQLLVVCYDHTGNVEELISRMEQITLSYEYQDFYNKLLVYEYTRYAASLTGSARSNAYLNALGHYEKIQHKDILSQADMVSIANAYLNTNRQGAGEAILIDLLHQNTDDYSIYMQLALYYYNAESMRGETVRDYSKTMEYYELAEQKYASVQIQGKMDQDMARLEQVIENLRTKGWID